MAQAPPAPTIIVGAGVFGASTALHLIKKYPNADITLVDRNGFDAATRVAASWDWNKVVRSDYNDIVYTKMGLEARDVWINDPLWKPFYHESGIYWISATGFAQQVLDNFKELGVKAELYSLTVDEARKQYNGMFDDADYTGIKDILVNKTSGWAAAKEALQKIIETAVSLGVKYVEAEVSALEFDSSGNCTGLRTQAGGILSASRTVLCTGAFTPRLLSESAPDQKDLHAGGRIIAAAVTEGFARLDPESASKYCKGPVCIQEVPPERGASNGSVPHTADNLLKFWGQWIFKNTLPHSSGTPMSMPPPESDYAQWNVPESLKDDVRFANKCIFDKQGAEFQVESFRICWEALTPSEDFIISPHPACQGLYIATCGSFHGWKFFPILGGYVLEMLEGSLEASLVKKWAWDRELPATDDNVMRPKKELKDLL